MMSIDEIQYASSVESKIMSPSKIVISLGFLLFFAHANSFPKPFHEQASTEITVSDLHWQIPDQLPQDIRKSKDYLTWLKDVGNEQPAWFANIDVDSNEKTHEILIASSLSGAGGRNFLLVTQAKTGKWQQLATIFGAPIFMKSKPIGYADLQTYHRNGLEMWLQLFKYSNGRYKFHSITLMPRAIVTECFYQRWLQLNLLASSQSDETLQKHWKMRMQSSCPELNEMMLN